jgi:hypothetical protein
VLTATVSRPVPVTVGGWCVLDATAVAFGVSVPWA